MCPVSLFICHTFTDVVKKVSKLSYLGFIMTATECITQSC